MLWRKLKPDRWTRTRQVWVAKWWTFNYGRESQGDGVQVAASVQLLNYWKLNLTLGKSWATWDDKLTRGGPTVIRPGIESLGPRGHERHPPAVLGRAPRSSPRTATSATAAGTSAASSTSGPWTALTLPATPYWLDVTTSRSTCPRSSIPRPPRPSAARYVFGGLDQRELSMPLRVNLVLSPKLSLQLYTQALLSTGDYPEIKELAAPRTYDFPVYGVDVGTLVARSRLPPTRSIPTAGGRRVRSGSPIPDFNVKALRANAVLRWEFRLGSAVYLVWTQRRQDQAHPGDFSFGRDLGNLFAAPGDDVLLVKIAWWFGR